MGLTIALADDHPLVRHGLRAALEGEPDFTLLGEATDGLEAAELVERLKPDVLILDLMMPGLNGLEVLRQAYNRSPATRVVVLSMHANEAYVLQALRNGAAGYVLKDACVDDLVQAVREVGAGRRYLSANLSQQAIEAYVEKAQVAPCDSYETLTTREREVLQLSAEGRSNGEIATPMARSRPGSPSVHGQQKRTGRT
jgi:DNA-binding NarL/FixJ family response regulator